jgi:hypothetical protein
MTIVVTNAATALQAIALLSVFLAIYGVISALRGGIVATLDSRPEDRRHWYNNREPFVSRFTVYRGRAMGVAIVILSLLVLILCGLGSAPAHSPLRMDAMQALWYVFITAFIGIILIAALWLFMNKMWISESSE